MRIEGAIRTTLVSMAFAALACSADRPNGTDITSSHAMLSTGTVGGLSVSLVVQSDWSTGYCDYVNLTNTGKTSVSNWTVGIDLRQSTLSSSWNTVTTQSGTVVTFKPSASWNATITAGSTVSIGFCGTKTGTDYQPSLVSINGQPVGGTSDAGTDTLPPVDTRPADVTCVPRTCASAGANCGSLSDNCGGTLSCGSCTAPDTCGGGGTANKCGSPSNKITATLSTQTTWQTGFCDNVTVTNPSTIATTSWTVVLQITGGTMNQLWNADGTTVGSQVTAKSFSWNGAVAAGQSTSFGFCVTKTGTTATAAITSATAVFATPDAGVDAPANLDSTALDVAIDLGPDVGPDLGPDLGIDMGIDVQPPVDTQIDTTTLDSSPGVLATTWVFQTNWETGYCANATVSNGTSAAIASWTVVINLNQAIFSQIWNATQTGASTGSAGAVLTIKPGTWNSAIPAGGTAAFGFCATKAGANYQPTVVSTTGS
jgi:cellulase/cellobiase CelA1